MHAVATKIIPLAVPYIPTGTAKAVSRVLNSRWIGQGPAVDQFDLEGHGPCLGLLCNALDW